MVKLIKGFHDILPDQTPKWSFITSTARTTLERFGFREIIPPVMERTELFQRGIGEVTDIVEKEMYTFEDRNGDSLSLRPEATAGILRAVAEHALLRKEPVLKLFSIGPMFRRERPSKGRFRQFFQINAEVLGEDSPLTDAETIAAAHAIMTNIGAQGLIMEINSVGCSVCRPEYRRVLQDFLRDRLEELCPDCRRRYHRNPLRILDCKVPECEAIARECPVITESLDGPCIEHFDAVRDALDMIGIPYRVESGMVRGLDYYTRTAFEIVHDELGRTKAVGGGGRYDNLLKDLGGPEAGGIGFAMGVERLAMGLSDDDPRFRGTLDAYVAAVGDDALGPAFKLTASLRREGYSVEARYNTRSLKSHMKTADKLGARRVIMIGNEELARGEVTIRDMRTKDQKAIPVEAASDYLRGVEP
ncbi:MAG: histidine--tRNA ligase [Pseudomonadota bacterium]